MFFEESLEIIYNFGYFYTFNTEIGESAPSIVSTRKVQRRWSNWNLDIEDDTKSGDQLAAIIPESVWNAAVAARCCVVEPLLPDVVRPGRRPRGGHPAQDH